MYSPPDPHQDWLPQDGSRVTVTRRDVPPLVTVRPPGDRAQARTGVRAFGPSPYRNQELLLGTRVYTVPRLTVRTATGRQPSGSDDEHPGLRVGALPYALLSRRVVEAVLDLTECNLFSKGLFAWVGFPGTTLEYENAVREHGRSSWTFRPCSPTGSTGSSPPTAGRCAPPSTSAWACCCARRSTRRGS